MVLEMKTKEGQEVHRKLNFRLILNEQNSVVSLYYVTNRTNLNNIIKRVNNLGIKHEQVCC